MNEQRRRRSILLEPMRRLALPFVFSILVIDAVIGSLLYPVFGDFIKGLAYPQLLFGIAMFVFSLAQFISAPVLGAVSDARGRRPVFRLAAVGTYVSMLLLLPIRYGFFLFGRFMDGTTNGLYAVVKSAIVDLSPEEDVQRNVGLSATISYVGFILGPGVASIVLWFAKRNDWGDARSLIVAGVFFAGVNVALSFNIPETKRDFAITSSRIKTGKSESLKQTVIGALRSIAPSVIVHRFQSLRRNSPNLSRILAISALFAIVTGYYTYFIIYVARGPLKLEANDISILFLYFAFVGIFANTVFFGKVIKRLDTLKTLKSLLIIGFPVMLTYALVGDRLWVLYVALTLDMLTLSLVPGLLEGLIGQQASEEARGEVFGLNQGLQSLTGLAAIGIYTATSLIDIRLPFVMFAIPLVACIMILRRVEPAIKQTA
jgi:MFS transporter, DHA1 family, tetracycline resistance protein